MQALPVSTTAHSSYTILTSYYLSFLASYRCHKGCASKAPHSCGLPPELVKYFRQQYLKKGCSNSFDCPTTTTTTSTSSSEPYARRPTISRGQTYDPDTRENSDGFEIQELSKEPTKGTVHTYIQRHTGGVQ